MMFLGIYLHAVVAYSPNGGWPFKPPQLTTTLDYSTIVIHIFRMPVFYVMAGFFAALLLQRYGSRRAIANRFWRIAVPFVVGWIIIYPLAMFLAASAVAASIQQSTLSCPGASWIMPIRCICGSWNT